MPYEAIDPASGNMQPVQWFLERDLTQGICDICGTMMSIRADKTPGSKVHFWHGNNSPSSCPASSKNKLRYDSLPASATHQAAGQLLKEQVRQNLHTVYLVCQAVIDGPIKKKDFIDAIKRANKINVWEYSNLTLEFVPYVLLCFIDTYQQTRWVNQKKETLDTHFILDPKIGNLDDLWNRTHSIKQYIWQLDKAGNIIKKMDIIPDLNITPPYFRKWVNEVFPEREG